MRFFSLFTIMCFNICLFGQSKTELKNISHIDSIVNSNLESEDYLCYSVGDKIVVVSKNKLVYFFNSIQGFIEKRIVNGLLIDTLFDENNIRSGKRFCNDDYNKSCVGTYVYLSFYRESKKVFDFNLPYMLLCDKKKVKYPFNYQALKLLDELLVSSSL